ncbi:glutamyl-Q-tRNA synthetase [Labilithrix luteola]|uniref:Glutamyl-Q tRNA(Asp) synthetase n=1 Tax=Labilithrix luteola TaxID=1391654 RepID=A0A0K1PRJ9_9BACT|nr:tRNA glutamyl-Q(34) synthetase GluQRS [Labilithrix luteola]AKU96152.1 glutamyl-Q-tRNA synthetase [Labilithrix luteola]
MHSGSRPLRTRFAPSPTGDLHLGSAWTALASWALARASGGITILRVEDVDTPRVVPGSAARIATDLAWLGLEWDEGPDEGGTHAPYIQSARSEIYDDALRKLEAAGLTYLCDCSRAEIARVASAPHAGEEMVYPGTCRHSPPDRELKRAPAIRLRVPDHTRISFVDRLRGPNEQHVDVSVGDFVLRRGDGVYAYQLVVAVDDALMNVSDVVRGVDLLGSTARQILLMRMLGFGDRVPSYTHVPLVVAPGGERLAKRTQGATVRELRERGVQAEEVVGHLAHGLGLVKGRARDMTASDVAKALVPPEEWRKDAWPIPAHWQ